MKQIVFSLFAATAMFCLVSCGTSGFNTSSEKSQTSVQLLETQFDIFNLHWGCSKEFVEKNCDFGGKPTTMIVAGRRYKVEFSQTSVTADFLYNSRNELCSVDMLHFYPDKEFASAVDFFFHINSILSKKYPDENNPNKNSNRYTLDRYFKYIHLPTAIRYEHFLRADFHLTTIYETTTTRIELSVFPWSRPNSLDTVPVFILSYKSKQIRSDIRTRPDTKASDSKGL